MVVIAVLALVFATIRAGVAALLIFGLIAASLYRDVRSLARPASTWPKRPSLTNLHFTIGWAMIVIAATAIAFATTESGLAALAVCSLLVFYYAIYRYGLRGPPLPRRHRLTSSEVTQC
jgi:hypothetical protein